MASYTNIEFSNLTEADLSSGFYKWMTLKRPDNPSSEFLKEEYDEHAPYYESLFCKKMGWWCWYEGTDVFHGQMEKFGFKKETCILDAGAGTGLVGTCIYLY